MRDPLHGFEWPGLHEHYKAMCKGFKPYSEHLQAVEPHVSSDLALYRHLLGRAHSQPGSAWEVTIGDYEAMLYWKLYSLPAARGLLRRLRTERDHVAYRLDQVLRELPASLERDVAKVLELIRTVGRFGLLGMKSPDALPVRTTFLHFLYPNVVPIFDKMVLLAVGAWEKDANKKLHVLREYIPHAWRLADRHTRHLSGLPGFRESAVRLVDMALWVGRGGQCRSTGFRA